MEKVKKIKIWCRFNRSKIIEVKKSKCNHFYQRQLINKKAITNWQRRTKKDIIFTIKSYAGKIELSNAKRKFNF